MASDPLDGQSDLQTTLTTSTLDQHLALFYRTVAEQRAVVVDYVSGGLQSDARCLYIADEQDPETIEQWLRDGGIDVGRYLDTGQLVVVDAVEVYSEEGFDPEETVDSFADIATDAVEAGFEGLRAAGENTWGFEATEDIEELMQFESNFEGDVTEMPVTAMCQYDIDQFTDATLADALQTHAQIIWDGELIENPYYVPPSEYVESGSSRDPAELLLDQSRDVMRSRRAVESREERLSVLNRVLRHNLRNEANVLLGRADMLVDDSSLDEASRSHLETIEDVTERLLAISEQARHVDETLSQVHHEPRSVIGAVEAAIDRAESELSLSVACRDSLTASYDTDPALETALYELLAVVGRSDERPTVRVTAAREASALNVAVETDGDALSTATERALHGHMESVLEHCLGLRAWITRWIVEGLGGTIVVEASENGQRVTLTIPATERPH